MGLKARQRWLACATCGHTRTSGSLVTLPEFFALSTDGKKPQWTVMSPKNVPADLGLTQHRFERPTKKPQEPRATPDAAASCWKKPGPVAGPFKAHLGNASVVTYYWYRFADQPAMLNADLTTLGGDSPLCFTFISTQKICSCEPQKVRLIAPTKAETALLDPFQGLPLERIHLPKTVEAIEQAGREIFTSGIAGFDTESKPTFSVGEKSRGPHVVQFALRDRAFIFQLYRPECRALVTELLQSEQILKVGFGLRNDRGQIRATLGVGLRGILDLDHVFRKRGYKGQIGVRAAVGAVLQQNFRKSKRVTTSNWAAPNLTPAQFLYAANDAFAALQVMEALRLTEQNSDLRSSGSFSSF